MTNHAPIITSSSVSDSFSELLNTTDSTVLHQLSGTMNFADGDHSDTHTTNANLVSAVLSSGSIIPAASLTSFDTAMTSQILSDHNGSGQLKWSFSDADDEFDFLAKGQTLTLTYDIVVSDNHGGSAIQTVKVIVTGTDDKPVINVTPVATVNEQADQTLSFSPDTAHVAINFTDDDLTNTGYTASVIAASASGDTGGILPGALGSAELMSFFNVDNVIKASGSSTGTINTTFSAPDLAFDYLAAGQQLNINYTVQLDDHAGGVTTQNVVVTVVGSNDKPVFLSGPESAHLAEDKDVSPAGNLTAHGDLFFSDVDLSDTHTVSTTVTASLSSGHAIPLSNAQLLAAFTPTLEDSTGHILGEVDWNFALANNLTNFIGAGQTLTLTYQVAVTDPSHATTTQNVTITILGDNHPVVITSGPESASVAELADTTGSPVVDTTPTVPAGTLNFTDPDINDAHTVAVSLASDSWSGGANIPAATQADLATAVTTTLHDSTGTGSGSIDWNFGLADQDFDFLAANEILTINYNVAVSDAATTAMQTVTVTVTGANDAPFITSGPEAGNVAELADTTGSPTLDTTTGTLAFTDADLSDIHAVNVALSSAVWSDGPFVPSGTMNDLQTALQTALLDSTGTSSGSVNWTFSIPDSDIDFLAAGSTLTATYDVTVTDNNGASSTQAVTITMTGAQDQLTVHPLTTAVSDTVNTDAGNFIAIGNLISDAGDTAGDAGVSLGIADVNGQASNVGEFVAGNFGNLLVFSDGTYLYQANANVDALQVGDQATDQFNFTVIDSLNREVPTTLTLNIAGADDAPTITGGTTFGSVTENAGPSTFVNGGFETGDLSGWSVTGGHIQALFEGLGGAFGNFAAQLAAGGVVGTDTLSQNVTTTPGQHYIVSFDVAGDPESGSNSFIATWDGAQILQLTNDQSGGFTHYTFDVVGDPFNSATQLLFTYGDDGTAMSLDNVSVSPETAPATETTNGSISFADVETADTHIASFVPQGNDYVGTFSLDAVNEAPGSGTVGWHFSVDNSAIQFLAQGQALTQDYLVTVTDSHGASTVQDVTVTINGINEAPTAVSENVVTDVDANGTVDIPAWALAANDTDPDATDHVSVNSIQSSSGGNAVLSGGDVFFTDDATLGGSFTYDSTDNIAVSSNTATATVINNTASTTALVGAAGDNILIATQAGESLTGGSGNNILIGNSGSHVMTGGGTSDTFAFLHTTDGPDTITDFNNVTANDHIAVSAGGFGAGLTAGMDVTPVFETSNDNQFAGAGAVFHFDTGNQTLYFSADGTTANEQALAQVQVGVTINPHDLLIV